MHGDGTISTSTFARAILALLVAAPVVASERLDAVVANEFAANSICRNDGARSFTCDVLSPDSNHSEDVALADLDGDGDLDLVFANVGEASRVCLNGCGVFSCVAIQSDPIQFNFGVALADVDGDGDVDAVFANNLLPATVLLNDGDGNARHEASRERIDPFWSSPPNPIPTIRVGSLV